MKKFAFIIVLVLVCAVFLPSCSAKVNPDSKITKQTLTMKNGEYKILHLADLHECLHERDILDQRNTDFINKVLDYTKPDLVVLGGDNIFPLSLAGELFKQETLKTIDEFCKLFDERQQPWTLVFGNHDDEAVYDKDRQYRRAMKNSKYFVGSLEDTELLKAYVDKKQDMVGNLAIPIFFEDGGKAFNVFLLDSGSARKIGKKKLDGYNYIRSSQIDWYKNIALADKEAAGRLIPAIAITHIPLYEHREAFQNRNDSEKVLRWVYDAAGDYALSKTQSDFYTVAVDQVGDMKAIFTGHNHRNGFTAVVRTANGGEVMLSTSRQAGVYWESGVEYTRNSGRLITLKADGSIETYEYHTEPECFISIN